MEADHYAARRDGAARGVVNAAPVPAAPEVAPATAAERLAEINGARTRVMPPPLLLVVMLLAATYGFAVLASTFAHPGVIGPNYNTPGTDYMVFHGGVAVALRHDWALLFDADRFTDFLNHRYQALLSFPLTYRPWVYPPSFLLLLLPFAPFGFRASWALYQAATAGALVAALCAGVGRRGVGRGGTADAGAAAGGMAEGNAAKGRAANSRAGARLVLAAACLIAPAASVNMLWGQSAFLTAAILIGGTRLLPRRPILAGLVFGLLSLKPQHGLLVPFMLLAIRAWPTLAAAALTALLLAAASVGLFGLAPWQIWVETARHFAADVPLWDSSLHTCAVLLGAGPVLANLLMGAALIGGAAMVYVAFRRPGPRDAQLALLLAASTLAAPHTGPYDTLLLVIAAGLVLTGGAAEVTSLAWTLGLCLWLLPFFGQPLVSPVARFGPLLTVVLLVWLSQMVRRTSHIAAQQD